MKDKEILENLIKYLKTNKNALARELKTSASTFRNIETGRNGISSKIAKCIVDRYPEINYDWLIGEDCPMLVKAKSPRENDLLLKRVELLEQLMKGQDARLNRVEERLKSEKNLIIPII